MSTVNLKVRIEEIPGVRVTSIEQNRTQVECDGIDHHSIRVNVTGGDDGKIGEVMAIHVPFGVGTSGEIIVETNIRGLSRIVCFSREVRG